MSMTNIHTMTFQIRGTISEEFREFFFHVQHVQHKADLQMDSRPSQVVV
jgi:hypothetical protein